MWSYESDEPFWKLSTCFYLYLKANYEISDDGHAIRFPYGWHHQTSLEQKEEASAGLKHKEINKSQTSWSWAFKARGCQGYELSLSEEKEPFKVSDAAFSVETSSNTFILPFQSLLQPPFSVNIHYECEEATCDTFHSLRSKEAFLQSNLSSLQATSYAALQPSSFILQPSFSYSQPCLTHLWSNFVLQPNYTILQPGFAMLQSILTILQYNLTIFEPNLTILQPNFTILQATLQSNLTILQPIFTILQPNFIILQPNFTILQPSLQSNFAIFLLRTNSPDSMIYSSSKIGQFLRIISEKVY